MSSTISRAVIRATDALLPYEERDGEGVENITDLLTDLRHFCREHDVDFEGCLESSKKHFDAEEAGED